MLNFLTLDTHIDSFLGGGGGLRGDKALIFEPVMIRVKLGMALMPPMIVGRIIFTLYFI